MRSLLSLLILGVMIFAVAGWFLDWYDISKVKSDSGKSSYQVDFNRDKIKEDLHKGGQKLNQTIEHFGDDKSKSSATPSPNRAVSTNSGWSPLPN